MAPVHAGGGSLSRVEEQKMLTGHAFRLVNIFCGP
jgi:hypothetical protein